MRAAVVEKCKFEVAKLVFIGFAVDRALSKRLLWLTSFDSSSSRVDFASAPYSFISNSPA